MKRWWLIFLLAGLTSTVVVSIVYSELQKGNYAPSQMGSLIQRLPNEPLPDSSYQVSAYPAPVVELAHGDGLQEVQSYCNTCHSPRYITMQPLLPAASWGAEVKKMNETFGAKIPEESSQKITLYLQAHYTPGKRDQ
jgi:mono/diheme cytochrome c family protein